MRQYFAPKEFKCRCGRKECDATAMKPLFLAKLEALRHEWGEPLVVSSGARCPFWNKECRGSPRSQHLMGNAADLIVPKAKQAAFVELAVAMNLVAVPGPGFVHVDDGPKRTWTYA